ncbi:MAG: tRNA (guanosine(37)-N1)-methyltransferase TrmD [Clostridia bacterium]|nr:tRNA (guanosine(37)-N1)-methyltransferase TrmD [Clostridia bacterium]
MKIDILTLFPEMFDALNASLIGKAQDKGAVQINIVNIRDFSGNKHGKVDDYPFGGGDGMVMMPGPLYDAIESVKDDDAYVIYMSPKGTPLVQKKVENLAKNYTHLVLVCGHYEGIDERVIELCVDEQISIGDFVLTGGEIPAMALVDSVLRFLPNVLHNEHSTAEESFSDGYLEYPQYTRPREFKGLEVPEVLVNGNHKEIAKWREEQKIEQTKKYRPDLLDKK